MIKRNNIKILVSKAKEGDKLAFEALYNEYKNKVYFFALRYVKSTGIAEDMTSETFVTALESISALRQNESFVGWLYTICYNKCIHYIKEESKAERLDDDNALDTSEINDAVMLPDDYAVNEQTKAKLREMIDSLDTKSRSAIIMYYYDELSIREIAKAQGISENAADLRLFRARKKLKKQIEKLFSKGSMLMAFPLSALLENISFEGFAAKGGKAAVKKSLAMKIAAISAAGIVVVSAGAVLLKKQFGDERREYSDLSLGLGTVNVCDEGILSSERGFVHFTDFASGESAVLCSRPDCRHDDENCYAYFDEPVFEDIYDGSLYVVDNGDTLNGSKIYKCNTDGSDRKVIAEFDCQGALDMTYVMKGGKLFCFTFNVDTQTNDMTYYPTIIDLENGKASKGEALIDGFKMLYADGERMYYSFLETKTDLNEYMQNHTSDEIDKYISNPDNLKPTSGTVQYNGQNTSEMGAEFRRLLGFMPQQQGLYPNFTLERFLYYMAALKGMSKPDAKADIERLIGLVNLDSARSKRLGGFSGGMKQRALIAQAMLGDPKIIILDEPTAGLDPKERIRIRNLVAEIAFEKIVIIATHVVSDIEFIAKEVLLLKQGELIGKGKPFDLCKTIEGKVFEITASEEQLSDISDSYKVGNISKDEQNIYVRVISKDEPNGYKFTPVKPDLEDLYLYYFD